MFVHGVSVVILKFGFVQKNIKPRDGERGWGVERELRLINVPAAFCIVQTFYTF